MQPHTHRYPLLDLALSNVDRLDRLRVSAGRKAQHHPGVMAVAVLLCVFVSRFGGEARAAVAPVVSSIPDQVTDEDEPILHVPFTVWDADTPPDQLRFSAYAYFNVPPYKSNDI